VAAGYTVQGRIESELISLRNGRRLTDLELLEAADSSLQVVRELSTLMLKRASGLESPPVSSERASSCRAHESVRALLDELESWQELSGQALGRDDLVAAWNVPPSRSARRTSLTASSSAIFSRRAARRFKVVFVVGLEEGSLPRRSPQHELLGDEAREELEQKMITPPAGGSAGARPLSLLQCLHAPLREALSGARVGQRRGLTPSGQPVLGGAARSVPRRRGERWTKRRSLSRLVWEDPAGAPSERERLRSLAALASSQSAQALALARVNGWERQPSALCMLSSGRRRWSTRRCSTRCGRAAPSRSPSWRPSAPARRCGSSSASSSPREIDGEIDAKLRGSTAHQTLYRFYSGLPKRFGADRVEDGRLDEQLEFPARVPDGCDLEPGAVWSSTSWS